MSAFFQNFWITKSITNFGIFSLFVSGTAYVAVRYNVDRKLEHPVIKEALKLMENHM